MDFAELFKNYEQAYIKVRDLWALSRSETVDAKLKSVQKYLAEQMNNYASGVLRDLESEKGEV